MAETKLKLASYLWGGEERRDFLRDLAVEYEKKNNLAEFLEFNTLGRVRFSPVAYLYGQVAAKLHRGMPLWKSLKNIAPSNTVLLLLTGVQNNNPVEGARTALDVEIAIAAIRAGVFKTLMLPLYFFIMVLIATVIIGVYLAPDLAQFGISEQAMGPFMYGSWQVCEVIRNHALIAPALIFAVGYAIWWSLGNMTGVARKVADKCFPLFSIYKAYRAGVFLTVFSALVRNNKTGKAAIREMMDFATPFETEHLRVMAMRLVAGKKVPEALDTGLLPKQLMLRIRRYYANKQGEQFLQQIGKDMLGNLERQVTRKVKVAGYGFTLFSIVIMCGQIFDVLMVGVKMQQSFN